MSSGAIRPAGPAVDPRATLARVDRLLEIPTLPGVVTEALRALDDDDLGPLDLARVLSQDSALTSKLLRIANSVVLNPSGKSTHSVSIGLSRLGFAEVRNLVLSVGVVEVFGPSGFPIDYAAFWRHSLATAHAARTLARRSPRLGESYAERAFVCGLMHDIGIAAIGASVGEPYARVFALAKRDGYALDVVEQARLGVTHPAVGERILQRWRIPIEICAAVAYHERPDRAPAGHAPLAFVTHLADVLAERHAPGATLAPGPVSLVDETCSKLGLLAEDEPELVREFVEETKQSPLAAALGLPA